MPFVSSNLDYAHPRADGRLRCRATHVDDAGRIWVQRFDAADLADANATMAAYFDTTEANRREFEFRSIIASLDAGDAWSTINPTLFANRARVQEEVVRRFKRSDPEYAERMAPHVASMQANRIEQVMQGVITAQEAASIRAEAQGLETARIARRSHEQSRRRYDEAP